MAFSNGQYTDADIEKIAKEASVNDFVASKAGIRHYAKEAIEQLRELTDMNDEEIFDEITSYGPLSEYETSYLARILGLN